MKQKTRSLAMASLSAALATVFLAFGSAVPMATYAAPILALFALIPAAAECPPGMTLTAYAAASILSLMLAADKECALVFLFLGYYPALRPKLEALRPKLLRTICKLAVGLGSMALLYSLLIFLFHLQAVQEELLGDGYGIFAATVVLFGAVWLLTDTLLGRLTVIWKRRKK